MTSLHDIRVASPRIGDVVTLKTGGPRMTVTDIGGTGDGIYLTCQWFAFTGEFRQQRFAVEAVVLEPTTITAGRASLRAFAAPGGLSL